MGREKGEVKGERRREGSLRGLEAQIVLFRFCWVQDHTFIPAFLHLQTASGTLDRGGSIRDIRPTKQSSCTGKFPWNVYVCMLELFSMWKLYNTQSDNTTYQRVGGFSVHLQVVYLSVYFMCYNNYIAKVRLSMMHMQNYRYMPYMYLNW